MFRFRVALILIAAIGAFTLAPAKALMPTASQNISLTVFAASSLSQSFTLLGTEFENRNPGVRVLFSFLSSATLANQINAGAPADVFASASEGDMRLASSRIPAPTNFVANRIVVAFPKNGKMRINKLVDLNQKGLKWIQCSHTAPCGAVADASLRSFGKVTSSPVSFEPNAASAVAKLIAGEVDAAIIYHTDYVAHKNVLNEIRFPDIAASTTQYQIGVTLDSKYLERAQSFMNFVLSPHGRGVLSTAGFVRVK